MGLLIVCVLGGNARSSVFISVVREPTKPSYPASAAKREAPRHVLTAAIEHTIPERGVKVFTARSFVYMYMRACRDTSAPPVFSSAFV